MICSQMKRSRLRNERGSILIFAYFLLAFLVTLSAGFALTNFGELNDSRRYLNSVKAFWLAEAALNEYLQEPEILDGFRQKTLEYPGGQVVLQKDDSQPMLRILTAKANVSGSEREITMEFPAHAPEVFNNTISARGDIDLSGSKISATFTGKTKVSGKLRKSYKFGSAIFEDLSENVDKNLVTMFYPDANNNGVVDEFDDFVAINRNIIENYSSDEVVYLRGNDTFTVVPDAKLAGKKILYAEGTKSGKGSVVIQFTGELNPEENLTVISTGTVSFNQLGGQTDSQLNIIAWEGYREMATLPGEHKGITYTHGSAVIDRIHEESVSHGILVAHSGVSVKEIWANKLFQYADPRVKGLIPPGFEGMIGGKLSAGYLSEPSVWREK